MNLDSLVHSLIGCDWGSKIALPNDRAVCGQKAAQRIVIHNPAGRGALILKLCTGHLALIEYETDPHTE